MEDDGGDTGRGTSNSSAASAVAAANIGRVGSVEVVPVFSAAVASTSRNRSATNSSTTSADLSLTSPRGCGSGAVVPGLILDPYSANTLTVINTKVGREAPSTSLGGLGRT